MRASPFGRSPSGDRLAALRRSPHYRDGQFQNLLPTPALTEGVRYGTVLWEFLTTKAPGRVPVAPLPSEKTDLRALPPEADVLVWFGHSSYFLQLDGKRLLVDPVFSGNASPVRGTTKAFPGTDRYTPDDLPPIDVLFLSHDHYDHADAPTLQRLQPQVQAVVTGLGVGAHLEAWGYPPDRIRELDWNDAVDLGGGFRVTATPARHFSGRTLRRNTALWLSFVLQTPSLKLFLGGDSGYGPHFKAIGDAHGPFDLAILECGQYDPKWKYIHMAPEETLQAARDLGARRLLPVHHSKFALANHAWDAPLRALTALNEGTNLPLLTPRIGERVDLKDEGQTFRPWWTEVS